MAKPKKEQGSRGERKALLKELRGNTPGKMILGYADYMEKMEVLDALLEKYSAKNIFGAAKTVDAKAKQDILKAMRETAEAGEEYLHNAVQAKSAGSTDDLKKGAPGLVNRLQGLLIRDEEALQAYDPRIPMSMTQVQENARSTVVHLGSLNVEGLGGAQNSRLPITFRDREGKLRRGVFTRKVVMSGQDSLDNYVNGLLQRAADQCGSASKETVRNLIGIYREKHAARMANAADAQVFHELFMKCVDAKQGGNGIVKVKLNLDFMKKDLGIDPDTQLRGFAQQELRRAFLSYGEILEKQENVGKYINSSILGIEEGSRVDSRNTAMSAVAKLLGAPGLIAGSENMKFVNEKGEVVEGTFMEEAEGIDLMDGGENLKMVNDHPFEGPDSYKGIRQMADLQVLDYICGNVDRHQGNLFYKTDANGDVVGVQGIDNDSSFGRFAHKDNEKHVLPDPDEMNVISASMSKKVMKLTPAMLKYALRGRGLTEEELDFAAKRLENMQTAIKNGRDYYKDHPAKDTFVPGYLRTLEDKEFKTLKLSTLCRKGQLNLFGLVQKMVQERFLDEAKESPALQFDPSIKKKEMSLRDVNTVGRGFTGGYLLDALSGAARLAEDGEKNFRIDDLTKAFRGSSPEFDAMAADAKKLAEMEKELLAKPEFHPSAYNRRRMDINEAVDGLRSSNDAYLRKKMAERGILNLDELTGKNAYEQARIDYAKRIHDFCEAYQPAPPLTGEELKQLGDADRAEMRHIDELAEMKDRDEAYSLLAEFHRKHGMEDPEKLLQEKREKQGLPGAPEEPEEPGLGGA